MEFAAGDRVALVRDLDGDPPITSGRQGTVVQAVTPEDANVLVCFDGYIGHPFRLVPKDAVAIVL